MQTYIYITRHIEKLIIILIILMIFLSVGVFAAKNTVKAESKRENINKTDTQSNPAQYITLEQFLKYAIDRDPSFSLILMQEHYLKYQYDLSITTSDLILEVLGQYGILWNETDKTDGKPAFEGTLALSKLFASTATKLSAEYRTLLQSASSGSWQRSSVGAVLSQSIARNAFGRLYRLEEKKIQLNIELARHQIVEAYEEYLASLISMYMDWYIASENLKTAQINLDNTSGLYKMIRAKHRYRVARLDDVLKVRLELIQAQENLMTAESHFFILWEQISSLAKLFTKKLMYPVYPDRKFNISQIDLKQIEKIVDNSRTWQMYQKMVQAGVLDVEIARHNLLPSAEFFIGYNAIGRDYQLHNGEHKFYFGLSGNWNMSRQKEEAKLRVAELDYSKLIREKEKNLLNFRIKLKKLAYNIKLNKQILDLARQKEKAARLILLEEKKNFNQGRVDFNAYLLAKNNEEKMQNQRIMAELNFLKLILEWQRLSDILLIKIS